MPFSKRWWISVKTVPVRGWILQQISKLSVAEFIEADVYIFVDSDIVFVRPFDVLSIRKDGRVRLFRKPFNANMDRRHRSWYHHAGKLFRLTDETYLRLGYIGPLVSWRRDTLIKLTNYIETVSRRGWKETLCNRLDFSEYTLYGVYSDFVLGDESGHYHDCRELCHCSWYYQVNNARELALFLEKLLPEHVAVLIQSNLGIEPQQYLRYIKGL